MKSLKVLEKAFDSPCEVPVAQLSRVEIGIQHLLRGAFQSGTAAQLHHVDGRVQELWEEMK